MLYNVHQWSAYISFLLCPWVWSSLFNEAAASYLSQSTFSVIPGRRKLFSTTFYAIFFLSTALLYLSGDLHFVCLSDHGIDTRTILLLGRPEAAASSPHICARLQSALVLRLFSSPTLLQVSSFFLIHYRCSKMWLSKNGRHICTEWEEYIIPKNLLYFRQVLHTRVLRWIVAVLTLLKNLANLN